MLYFIYSSFLSQWFELTMSQIKETTAWEWIAAVLGALEVVLAMMNVRVLYVAGGISTAIYCWLMAKTGLYAESILNIYYLAMSIYGLWIWSYGVQKVIPQVSECNRKDWMTTLGITAGAFIVLYFCLAKFTNSTVPGWDAWVSATAWAGMWQLAKRKIENWLTLNLSNAFAIPLLFYKKLPLTALLTLFLFIVALFGYYKWKKILQESSKTSEALL